MAILRLRDNEGNVYDIPAIKGEQGEKGDAPDHEVEGVKIRFKKPDGTWGDWLDLGIYIDAELASLVNSAPEALDTLQELAAALGNDPNFATTIMNEIGTKQSKNLGTANAGKFLVVGSDGNITAVTMDTWQGGSY